MNLAGNTTGVHAGTIECGEYAGYNYPGIYNVVGGDVSIFGGGKAKKSCIQQTASGRSVGEQWQCVPSSESVLEGLGTEYDSIRFSNFFL